MDRFKPDLARTFFPGASVVPAARGLSRFQINLCSNLMPGLSVSFIGYSARKPRRLSAGGSAAPYVELPLRVALPLTLKIDGGVVSAADEHGDARVRGGLVPVGGVLRLRGGRRRCRVPRVGTFRRAA